MITPIPTSPLPHHLAELEKLRAKHYECVPVLPVGCRSILEVACGIGQVLVTLEVGPHTKRVGVDADHAALEYGRRHFAQVCFCAGWGEALPFRSGSFDALICRRSLYLMDIPAALREFARVLRPHGYLWLELIPASCTAQELWSAVRHLQLRRTLLHAFGLLNSMRLHWTNRQWTYPAELAQGGRVLSFQTFAGMARSLRDAGFINVERDPCRTQFVMRAVRGPED